MDIENLIVIVTYNSQDFIEDCIRSVASSDIKKWFLAVIDNNSSDGTLKKLSDAEDFLKMLRGNPSGEHNFKYISLNKNIGFAAAVNHCVFNFFLKEYPEAAKNTQFLILINPDVYVEKNTLSNLILTFDKVQDTAGSAAGGSKDNQTVSPARSAADIPPDNATGSAAGNESDSAAGGSTNGIPAGSEEVRSTAGSTARRSKDSKSVSPEAGAAGAAGSLIYDYAGKNVSHAGGIIQDNFITSHIEKIPSGNNGLIEADYATGAVFATKFKYFLNLRGFDTGYRPVYFEEVDFCLKLQRLKLKVFINTGSVARHYEGASVGKFSANFYRYYHKNRLRCAIINLSPAEFFKRFIPAEARWLREKATHDQRIAIFYAYSLNFVFLIYNLIIKIKNSFLKIN